MKAIATTTKEPRIERIFKILRLFDTFLLEFVGKVLFIVEYDIPIWPIFIYFFLFLGCALVSCYCYLFSFFFNFLKPSMRVSVNNVDNENGLRVWLWWIVVCLSRSVFFALWWCIVDLNRNFSYVNRFWNIIIIYHVTILQPYEFTPKWLGSRVKQTTNCFWWSERETEWERLYFWYINTLIIWWLKPYLLLLLCLYNVFS